MLATQTLQYLFKQNVRGFESQKKTTLKNVHPKYLVLLKLAKRYFPLLLEPNISSIIS